MFSDEEVYMLKEDGLEKVEEGCGENKTIWATTFDGECSLIEKTLDNSLRNKIRKCYGIEMLRELEREKAKAYYFPFAAPSQLFLEILWKMNIERLFLRDFIFKHDSAFFTCDEVTFFFFFLSFIPLFF